jgi:hypothetical protein
MQPPLEKKPYAYAEAYYGSRRHVKRKRMRGIVWHKIYGLPALSIEVGLHIPGKINFRRKRGGRDAQLSQPQTLAR